MSLETTNAGLQKALAALRKQNQQLKRDLEKWKMLAIENDSFLKGVSAAYEQFKNEAIEEAIASSTKASWGGSGYSVELFPDGNYRVLWDGQIGNLYNSPGVIIGVSPCSDDDWDEDESIRFYDNAIEDMDAKFEQWKADYTDYLVNH
ncbi:MAG: hypothetical protein AB1589_39580 [Cyanobacteriota bacterium]